MEVMDILESFENRAFDQYKLDLSIKADPYETLNRLKTVIKIRKAICHTVYSHRNTPQYTLDELITSQLRL